MTGIDESQAGEAGWRPLAAPARPSLRDRLSSARAKSSEPGSKIGAPGPVNGFVRLARTHALHAAGDASYAVALVGSIFALDTDAARGRILLYLLLTLAPFALVGPFIGPALDRLKGGRRLMIVGTLLVRALLMLLVVRNIETLWLYPLAFTQLVMAKTYSVAKAATVPTTVDDESELVEKNSRLAVLGTVAGGVGAAPALALQAIWGSSPVLVYALLVYSAGVIAGLRLPQSEIEDGDEADDEAELRSTGVRLAASAMSVMRGISGFVFFLMVFAFGSNDLDLDGLGKAAGVAVRAALGFSIEGDNSQPAWKLGFVLASIGLGIFLGNIAAPRFRKRFVEEHMIIGALAAVLLAAAAAVWAGGLSGAWLLALVVGAAPASAKLAFDSLVQRDAAGANQGAAFARFETRFQIASVIGSVVAVAPTVVIPVRVGAFVVAIAAGAAATMYYLGSRREVAFDDSPVDSAIADAAGWLRSLGRSGDGPDGGDPSGETDDRVGRVQAGSAAGPAGFDPGLAPGGPQRWSAPPTLAVDVVAPGRADSADSAGGVGPRDGVDGPDAQGPDLYAEAFADHRIEAPDWAAPAFEDQADDPLLPPRWLDGHAPAPPPD